MNKKTFVVVHKDRSDLSIQGDLVSYNEAIRMFEIHGVDSEQIHTTVGAFSLDHGYLAVYELGAVIQEDPESAIDTPESSE